MQQSTRSTPNPCQLRPSHHSVLPVLRAAWRLALLLVPMLGQAQVPVIFPAFLYANNNGALTVTRYLGQDDVVTIPATANGLPVCSIGDNAFSSCSSLVSVTIPDSVTNIGTYAFAGCSGLTNLTLPASLRNIGDEAFDDCSGLTSVSLPNGVTNLGAYAFSGCSGLTQVSGGEGLTTIGYQAFQGCSSLVQVAIPNGVTSLGGLAFAGCSSLTHVAFPGSVTNIGNWAFADCPRLTSITVDALNPNYSSVDGVLFNKTQSALLGYPGGKAGNYVIPNGVTDIASAFSVCPKLTRVTLPSSVTRVGNMPFAGCANLQAILVPPQNPAFSSLGGVLFDKSHTTLLACPPGKSGGYTVPDNTVTIDGYAFANCSHLSSITLSSHVAHIGTWAFPYCQGLKAITVAALNPAYSSVAGVLFDKRQTTLVQYPLGRAGRYTIPGSVTNLGDFAFANAAYLTSITGGTNLLRIGEGAFRDCINLTNVAALSNVVELGGYAFEGCDRLTAITLGPRLTSLGYSAFADCRRLTAVLFEGDAPSNVGEDVFESDANTTVCYLSGKQGWDVSFGDCPTALWDGTYTITVSAYSLTDPSSGGSVEGGGGFVGGQLYTVRATPSPGYVFVNWTHDSDVLSTSPTYTFLLVGDRDLVANFAPNLFPALAGTYHGLIWNTNAAWPQNCGGFTLTVTDKGSCSGTLQMGGIRSGFSGQFDYRGQLYACLPAGGLNLQLDGASATGQVSGSVSNLGWVAQVSGERTLFNAKTQPATNYAGRYTLVFPGGSGATQAPVGASWAILSVTPSGLVNLKAALADGTKLTQAAALSQDGIWPLYVSLYQRHGMLVGWMGLTTTPTNDVSGNVLWTKLLTQTGPFPAGFELTTTATGSRYVPPAGAAVLNLTNAALVLAGPGLTEGLTNQVTLHPNHRVEGTNHTRLNFNLATGTFQGRVRLPNEPKAQAISFSGVVLQKQAFGCGWFGARDLWGQVMLSE